MTDNITTFSELMDLVKINFMKCVIKGDTSIRLGASFECSPKEFLSFAKTDFRAKDKRGLINSITNSKRAIDCQVDRVLKSLGYEFDNFPPYLTKRFCASLGSPRNRDAPKKLKILNAFGMTPTKLVSLIRSRRHQLEHFYQVPTLDETEEALDIAELFISATELKLMNFWELVITDTKEENSLEIQHADSGLKVSYFTNQKKETHTVTVLPSQEEYAPLMRMCLSFEDKEELLRSFIFLLELVKPSLPKDFVKIKTSVY